MNEQQQPSVVPHTGCNAVAVTALMELTVVAQGTRMEMRKACQLWLACHHPQGHRRGNKQRCAHTIAADRQRQQPRDGPRQRQWHSIGVMCKRSSCESTVFGATQLLDHRVVVVVLAEQHQVQRGGAQLVKATSKGRRGSRRQAMLWRQECRLG